MGTLIFTRDTIFLLDGVEHRILHREEDGRFLVEDIDGQRVRRSQDELASLLEAQHLTLPPGDGHAYEPPQVAARRQCDAEALRPGPNGRVAVKRDVALRQRAVLDELAERGVVAISTRQGPTRDLIEEVLVEHGFPRTTDPAVLWRWSMRLTRARGSIEGLLPGKPGPKTPRTGMFEPLAAPAIDSYLSPQGKSKRESYSEFKKAVEADQARRVLCGEPPLPRTPQFSWFRRLIDRIPKRDQDERRKGRDYARHKYVQTFGGPEVRKLLERCELDHKLIDVFLREDDVRVARFLGERPLVLGRPWLTCVRDCCSKMPLGIYLGFEPPSVLTVMLCLKHAIRRKDYLAADSETWQCQNPWPAYGKMFRVVVDQGLENIADSVKYAFGKAVIDIQHNCGRTPEQKADLERWFKAVDAFTRSLPGAVRSDDEAMTDRDPMTEDLLTVSEFIIQLHRWIVDEYCQRPHQGLFGRTPAAAWTEASRSALIRMPDDVNELDYIFAEHKDCQLTGRGIRLNNVEYNDRCLKPILDRYGSPCRVHIAYNAADLGRISVFDPGGGRPHTIWAKDSQFFAGLSLYRYNLLRQWARKKPGQGSDIEAWERAELRRKADLKARRARKGERRRTHKHDARAEAYGSQSLVDQEPSLKAAQPRSSCVPPAAHSQPAALPTWTTAADLAPFDDDALPGEPDRDPSRAGS